jgi:hypothetical protein
MSAAGATALEGSGGGSWDSEFGEARYEDFSKLLVRDTLILCSLWMRGLVVTGKGLCETVGGLRASEIDSGLMQERR